MQTLKIWHKTAIMFFILISQSCGPPHELDLPEDAWVPEIMPLENEYVMVKYWVRPIDCPLRRLAYGEQGLRWKVVVHLKDDSGKEWENKEFWAYKIQKRDKTGFLDFTFYAPIPMTIKELMKREARILLLSHDQDNGNAHVYNTSGMEFPIQLNDDFDWLKKYNELDIADKIEPGEYILAVKGNSKQDWDFREDTANAVAQALAKMSPVLRQRVEFLKKQKHIGRTVIALEQIIHRVGDYVNSGLLSGNWIMPLVSLGIFQSAWLLGFLTRPEIKTSPEYFGAMMSQRWFAVIMDGFYNSMRRAMNQIFIRLEKLENENFAQQLEIDRNNRTVDFLVKKMDMLDGQLKMLKAYHGVK